MNYANYIVNQKHIKDIKNIKTKKEWIKLNPNVSHFCVFNSVAWAHILDEKRKSLQRKSEKCIFVGYSKDVKGYKIIQPYSNEIIIRRYVKFHENILAYVPNSNFFSSSTCDPYSTFFPYYIPILVFSSYDDSEDENPPLPTHLHPCCR
jgi:hypothetical protein